MKRLFVPVIFSLVFIFTACSGDDDDSSLDVTLSSSGTHKGHGYVDLGLSVKWATMNVGADSPEDYGNYYAWGEIETKDEYSRTNSVTYGVEMDDISGNATYDAATANWGGSWRMPTDDEIEELVDECTWTWTSLNDVAGSLVTGSNGNSIFLPATGYYMGSHCYFGGAYGFYWSSTPYESDTQRAYDLSFPSGSKLDDIMKRCYGHTVRPVTTSNNDNSIDSDSNGDTSEESGTSYEKPEIGFYGFTATTTSLKVQYKIYNQDEAKVSSAKIYYGTSSNPSSYKTATVSGVLITARISGLKSGTNYYVKCVATGKGGTTTTSTTKCITNY